jgi:hypothetical protein
MTVTCPLEEVDRRLADAKRLWCKASDCYFDPDDFRIYAQNCIQTLRTVTFVLQAQKARIPNFDEWYAVHQDTMRNDTVLRWLVDARNRIEKRGDLRRRSVIRASLITWHLDEFEPFDFDAKLFDGLQTIFHRIPLWLLKKYVLVHGVLRIERRWVHDCLPGHEVLEALAHVFEKLQDLVAECHRQIGVEPDDEEHVKLLDGRPPEMAGREEDRTMYINLSDGSMMETDHEELDFAPTEKDEREFVERFGKPPATADFRNLSSLADFYFEYARRIFLDIGYLSTQAIIFGKNGPVIFDMASSSRQEKLVNHRKLAVEVNKYRADRIILISEAWTAKIYSIDQYVPASEAPDKREIIMLTAVNDMGETISLDAEILRDGDCVSLGPTQRSQDKTSFALAEVFKVWNLPIPSSDIFKDMV